MEPWYWVVGFVVLAGVDLAAWRRRDERARWAWSLWIVPAVLALYGLGWGLSFLGPPEVTATAWFAMLVVATLGVVPSLVSAVASRGAARGIAAVNACALAGLTTRIVVSLRGIELM